MVDVEWDRVGRCEEPREPEEARRSFEEARELFTYGSDYLEVFDADHSDVEDRFISIGPIKRGLVLVVWTQREDDVIRLISARWATTREQALYHQNMDEQS
jgi:uncharacterized protein